MPYYNTPYNYNFGYYPQVQPLMLNYLQDAMDIAIDEKDKKAVGRLIEQMMERN